MKKRCFENWENMPYTSEHLWRADPHGQPFGGCRKCGYPVETWNEKCFVKTKKLLRGAISEAAEVARQEPYDVFYPFPRPEADNWQDMKIEEKIEWLKNSVDRLLDGVDELLKEKK